MTTLEKIRADWIEARKARDATVSNLLGTIIAECENQASRSKVARVLTESDVIGIVLTVSKNVTQTMGLIKDIPSRTTEYAKLTVEAAALIKYIPMKLTMDELRRIAIDQSALGLNLGKIMVYLKSEYPDRYDGREATDIIKSVLSGQG